MSNSQYIILAALLPRMSDRDLEDLVTSATQILLRRRESPIAFASVVPFPARNEGKKSS